MTVKRPDLHVCRIPRYRTDFIISYHIIAVSRLHHIITPAEPRQRFSCQYITLLHRQNPGRDSAVSTSHYYTGRTRADIQQSVHHIITTAELGQRFAWPLFEFSEHAERGQLSGYCLALGRNAHR